MSLNPLELGQPSRDRLLVRGEVSGSSWKLDHLNAAVLAQDDATSTQYDYETLKRRNICGLDWLVVRKQLWNFHFLLLLLLTIGFALAWPDLAPKQPGAANYVCPTIVFFLTGLYLKTSEFLQTLRHWVGILVGVLAISVGVPVIFGFGLTAVNMNPKEFQQGLILFMCMPTALGTVTLLSEQAGGNPVMATVLGTITNFFGPLVSPLWLSVTLSNAHMDIAHLVWQLMLIVLLPLVVGKSLRYFVRVREATVRFLIPLKLLQSFVLLVMPWTALCGSAPILLSLPASSVGGLFGACFLLFLLLTLFGYFIALFLPVPVEIKKPIIVCLAMKTISIPLTLIRLLPDRSNAAVGLLSLSNVVGFILLLLLGTLHASLLAHVKVIDWRVLLPRVYRPVSTVDTDQGSPPDSSFYEMTGSSGVLQYKDLPAVAHEPGVRDNASEAGSVDARKEAAANLLSDEAGGY